MENACRRLKYEMTHVSVSDVRIQYRFVFILMVGVDADNHRPSVDEAKDRRGAVVDATHIKTLAIVVPFNRLSFF